MANESEELIDPFASIAEFYDLDFEFFYDDASFFERLVGIHGERVLELGVGTGRIAGPLAQAGAKVTGVDVSLPMMEIGKQRATDAGVEVKWVEADIRTLKLRGRFDVVLAPLGTMQHLETPDDFVAALETMARHLAPGGVAVIDIESPTPDDFDPAPQPLIEHWSKRWRDGWVSKLVSVEAIPSECSKEITWHFDVSDKQGRLTRITTQFHFRTFTWPEVMLGARIAGLRTIARFSDYEFSPYFDGAERMIVILQREDDEVGYIYESPEGLE